MFWERFYLMCCHRNTKPNPVAKRIGISSGVLTKWKTQGNIPGGEHLKLIADELDCSVDFLLGRTDNPQSHKQPTAGIDALELEQRIEQKEASASIAETK